MRGINPRLQKFVRKRNSKAPVCVPACPIFRCFCHWLERSDYWPEMVEAGVGDGGCALEAAAWPGVPGAK